jgi:hypothetical protein
MIVPFPILPRRHFLHLSVLIFHPWLTKKKKIPSENCHPPSFVIVLRWYCQHSAHGFYLIWNRIEKHGRLGRSTVNHLHNSSNFLVSGHPLRLTSNLKVFLLVFPKLCYWLWSIWFC